MKPRLALSALVLVTSLVPWLVLRERGPERTSRAAPAAASPAAGPEPEQARVELVAARLADAPEAAAPSARVEVESEPADSEAFAEDEGMLQVRVLSIESNRPVAGIPLRLETPAGEVLGTSRPHKGRGHVHDVLLTDVHGRADLVVPAHERYVLHANFAAPGGVRQGLSALKAHQFRTVVVELFAHPDLVWNGRVLDAESLAPIPFARLRLVDGFERSNPETRLSLTSERDGSARIECASDGPRGLLVLKEGYAPARTTLAAGHEEIAREERILLLRPASLLVSVNDAHGAPLSGISVTVGRTSNVEPGLKSAEIVMFDAEPEADALTDDNGRTALEDLEPRVPLSIQLAQDGIELCAQRIEPELEPRERRVLAFDVGLCATVAGRVVDQENRPVAGALLVLARPADPGAQFRIVRSSRLARASDAQGRFVFGDVPPGSWEVLLGRGQNEGASATLDALALEAARLTLAPGEERTDLELHAWRGLVMQGSVRRSDGTAASSGLVFGSGPEGATVFASIEANGSFVLGPLLPGTMEVVARSAGEQSPPTEVRAGDAEVVLQLEPAQQQR